MARRGRPPHPDVLTPREWEVLALLRDGLSNEEIAQRLGISLAGAKYHVSEILGKLGVGSREEAAAWQPTERPWWAAAGAPIGFLWRRLGSGWLATAIAVGVSGAVAAGIALLVWGLLRTGGSEQQEPSSIIPSPPLIGPAPPTRPVTFAPGQPIDVSPGVFYVDVETGAAEGWWGFTPIAISPNGRFIFYDRQRFVDADGGTCAVATADEPGNVPVFSPDSQQFVADWSAGVAIFSTHCGAPAQALALPEKARLADAAWAADGNGLLLEVIGVGGTDNPKEEPRAVYYVRLNGGEPLHVADGHAEFDWAPESSRFVLTSGATARLLDADSQEIWSRTLPVDGLDNPRWSPDGESIALHAVTQAPVNPLALSYDYSVYVLSAETGEIERTFEDAIACWGNPWTADGARLLVGGLEEPGYRLASVDPATEVSLGLLAFFAEPSPSVADVIAYLERGGAGALRGPLTIMRSEAKETRAIVSFSDSAPPAWDPVHGPRWLTDGRLVVYTGEAGHGGCIAP